MGQQININDIYDKNINFLIGSGASYGLFPTLALNIQGDEGKKETIETLATRFDDSDKTNYILLFMHYYKECIEPAMLFNLTDAMSMPIQKKVIENYEKFLHTILTILQRRKPYEKICNIFTTNYDGCFEHVADNLLQQGNTDFIINDGARGFNRRYLHVKNFNNSVYQTGIFGNHRTDVPQINLIHLHGSVYWYKEGENILIDYAKMNSDRIIERKLFSHLKSFSDILIDTTKTVHDIPSIKLKDTIKNDFLTSYNRLPIVNPTKWKFHETVFEEHYYQMLRLLSYELEKPNSIFITFGFSFADEHILNLVKRSLSNPSLQLFICCFTEESCSNLKEHFKSYKNVEFITLEESLDFTAFNNKVFSLNPETSEIDSFSEENNSVN